MEKNVPWMAAIEVIKHSLIEGLLIIQWKKTWNQSELCYAMKCNSLNKIEQTNNKAEQEIVLV